MRYALHVDGRTLTVYESNELEMALEHAQVVMPRTTGPVLVVELHEDRAPVIIERLPRADSRAANGY